MLPPSSLHPGNRGSMALQNDGILLYTYMGPQQEGRDLNVTFYEINNW